MVPGPKVFGFSGTTAPCPLSCHTVLSYAQLLSGIWWQEICQVFPLDSISQVFVRGRVWPDDHQLVKD